MPPQEPWNKPDYVNMMMQALEDEFQVAQYGAIARWGILPARFLNAFRNFQWVKTDTIQIARSAQPNYSAFKGDKDHSFTKKQIKFLNDNNIRTIFSFNAKCVKPKSLRTLHENGIAHVHIQVQDFAAMSLADHQYVDDVIRNRRGMGGFLFYCGYGQGRTGTAVAGVILKEVMLTEPEILKEMSGKQLHELVTNMFGVEKTKQTNSIVDYLRTFATVEPPPESVRPRSLPSVGWATFYDEDEMQLRPLPPLPPEVPPMPPPKVPNKNFNKYKPARPTSRKLPKIIVCSADKIDRKSLDPVGNIRDSISLPSGALKPPLTLEQGGDRSPLARSLLSCDGKVNKKSFYFSDLF